MRITSAYDRVAVWHTAAEPHEVYQTINMPTKQARYYTSHPPDRDLKPLIDHMKQHGLPNDDPGEAIELYTDGKRASLGNGNHRVHAAGPAGVSHVPVQVIPTSYSLPHGSPHEPFMQNWVSQQPHDWMKGAL